MEQLAIDPAWLKAELEKSPRSQSGLARYMRLSSAAIVNRMCAGTRDISAAEADKIRAYLAATARGVEADDLHIGNSPDQPEVDPLAEYVEVEVLPTFAGMGGGGTGDGDRETALVPVQLVRNELRARPSDLLLVNVRGTSMEPHFFNGDQLLIDLRDKSPTQEGPFAIRYGSEYAVKNVAWINRRTRLRISSSNPEFPSEEWDPNEVDILGRPVWFARRL